MSVMKLTCLRHGLTPLNEAHRFNGTIQEGITPHQRVVLEAVSFDHSRFDAIYCSHLARCIETAKALKIWSWITDARLAERSLGVFEGLTATECEQRYPDAFRSFTLLNADFTIPGGESRAEHLNRVLVWLKEATRYRNVLAITHGGIIDFLYRLGTGIPVHGGVQFYGSPNGSISTFDVDWPVVKLIDYGIALSTASDGRKLAFGDS